MSLAKKSLRILCLLKTVSSKQNQVLFNKNLETLERRPKNKLRVAFVGFGSYYADIYLFTSYFVLLDSYLNYNQKKFCLYAKISLIIKFLTWFKCFLSVEFESNFVAPDVVHKVRSMHA